VPSDRIVRRRHRKAEDRERHREARNESVDYAFDGDGADSGGYGNAMTDLRERRTNGFAEPQRKREDREEPNPIEDDDFAERDVLDGRDEVAPSRRPKPMRHQEERDVRWNRPRAQVRERRAPGHERKPVPRDDAREQDAEKNRKDELRKDSSK